MDREGFIFMTEPKDFAFLFKPGDYLRDTQCLSSDVQVAYDRIMCEMLRNICLTKDRLNFFTKRLTQDQKDELNNVIEIENDSVYIPWVKLSIEERISYCESRRKNRLNKLSEKTRTHDDHMKTYDEHMEGESDNDNKINNEIVFDEFRKKYPGSKRGLKTEYENFCKKHRDHNSVLCLLLPSLNNQSAWRVEMAGAGMFVPEWKNLQTWINQRCWEIEKPEITIKRKETQEEMLERLTREGKI